MKTSIEFYIPIDKLINFRRGEVVMYSPIAANGLIKLVTSPNAIVFVNKVNSNIYYIRKATLREKIRLMRRRKLK